MAILAVASVLVGMAYLVVITILRLHYPSMVSDPLVEFLITLELVILAIQIVVIIRKMRIGATRERDAFANQMV